MKQVLRSLATLGLILSLAGGLILLRGGTTFRIHDGDTVIAVRARADEPEKVLEKAGITLGPSDRLITTEEAGCTLLTICRSHTITLHDGASTQTMKTTADTVGKLLAQQGISLGPQDQLTPSLSTPLTDHLEITITRRESRTLTQGQVIFPLTVEYEDDTMEKGETKVLEEGSDGLAFSTWQILMENGVEKSRTYLTGAVTVPAKSRIVLVGTREPTRYTHSGNLSVDSRSSTVTTASGDVLAYTKVLSVEATAYSCEGYVGTTATGTTARYGAIAVDPSVIPYGTRMYIVSDDGAYLYGYATAEDCGGAIKGNRIDLYFDTIAECYQFGRRQCTVYILA